ncbi:hypothetical protein F4811DRAFT_367726 [Daldinia bambusicola]|nr:hypothetical protein F4811DRAFT_367726 [Daldinia bambusicola]
MYSAANRGYAYPIYGSLGLSAPSGVLGFALACGTRDSLAFEYDNTRAKRPQLFIIHYFFFFFPELHTSGSAPAYTYANTYIQSYDQRANPSLSSPDKHGNLRHETNIGRGHGRTAGTSWRPDGVVAGRKRDRPVCCLPTVHNLIPRTIHIACLPGYQPGPYICVFANHVTIWALIRERQS